MTLESCSAYLGAATYVWLNTRFWEFHCMYWLKTTYGNAHQQCMASSCSTRVQVFCRSYIKFIILVDFLNILKHLRCQQASLWVQKPGELDLCCLQWKPILLSHTWAHTTYFMCPYMDVWMWAWIFLHLAFKTMSQSYHLVSFIKGFSFLSSTFFLSWAEYYELHLDTLVPRQLITYHAGYHM